MTSYLFTNLFIVIFLLHLSSSIKPRTLSTFIPLHEPQFLSRVHNSWGTEGGNETIWAVQFRGQGSPKVILDLRIGFIMGSGRKPGDEGEKAAHANALCIQLTPLTTKFIKLVQCNVYSWMNVMYIFRLTFILLLNLIRLNLTLAQ